MAEFRGLGFHGLVFKVRILGLGIWGSGTEASVKSGISAKHLHMMLFLIKQDV